ncbi:MAG: Ig-like domain-containing protein, partial [Candidatus Thermoplasmatota archaeon]
MHKKLFCIGLVLSLLTVGILPIIEAANYAINNDTPTRKDTGGWTGTAYGDTAKFPVSGSYYTAVAMKGGEGYDYDIEIFTDYDSQINKAINSIGSSTRFGDATDIFIINGHAIGGGDTTYYVRVYPFFAGGWGASGFYIVESDYNSSLTVGTTRSCDFRTDVGTNQRELVDMYDVYFYAGGKYTVSMPSSTSALYRYQLYDGTKEFVKYIAQGTSTSPYTFYPTSSGWYGILMSNAERAGEATVSGTYDLLVYSDFDFSVSPSSRLIAVGTNATYDLTIASKGIVSGISLSVDWVTGVGSDTLAPAPAGTTNSTTPSSVYPGGVATNTSVLKVTTQSTTPAGTYYLRVTADDTSAGNQDKKVWVTLIVSDTPDFFITSDPDSNSITAGSSTLYKIRIDTINNFNSDITLSATIDPAEPTITTTFSPNPTTLAGGYTSNLTVNTTLSTPLSTYRIEIKGVGGSLTRYQNVTLTVAEPMSVNVINPTENEYIGGEFKFTARVISGITIEEVNFLFGGVMSPLGTVAAVYNSISGLWERTINTNPFNDGKATVTARATDVNGATGTSLRNFTLENLPPYPNILQPQYGEYVSGDNVSIRAETGTNVIYVSYRIDERSWVYMGGGPPIWNSTFDSTVIPDGPHKLSVQAKSIRGLIGESSIPIIIDNNPPTCNIIAPVKNQFIEGTFTFKVQATDFVNIKNVSISVFGENNLMAFNSQTGFYEHTKGTLGIEDQQYIVNATANDYANHTTNCSSISFNLDNNPPVLTILNPLAGEYIGSTYRINVTANDTFLDKVQYRIDTGVWVDFCGTKPNFYSDFDTTKVSEGAHTLTVRAIDLSGHFTETSIEIFIDNSLPIVLIASPTQNQYIEGTYTFRILAKDNVGIDRVEINVSGRTISTTYNTVTGYYEVIINSFQENDGKYNVTAKAYDKAGKLATHGPIDFYIDNRYPELSILYPNDGAYVCGTFDIKANSTDTPYTPIVECKIDNGNYIKMNDAGNYWNITWDTTALSDGMHTITIRSYDSLNHIAIQTITVTIDNHNPIGGIVVPIDGQYIEGTFVFKITARDEVGIDRVIINLFGNESLTTYNPLTGYYEYVLNTIGIEDGRYNVTAYIHDFSGRNITLGPIDFNIDNHVPSLLVTSPMHGTYVEGIVYINVSVNDTFLYLVEYRIDEGNWLPIINNSEEWNTTKYPDGLHKITIRAIDNATHSIEQRVDVIIDNNFPICIISAPIEGEYLEGTITFKIAATDFVGIKKVEIEFIGKNYTATYNGVSGYYEYVVNTILVEDGNYNITVRAFDYSGKVESAGLSFYIDNHAPSLVLLSPSSGEYLEGLEEINVSADDKFLYSVEYMVDSTVWLKMLGNGTDFKANFLTNTYLDGKHTISVRVIDNASHITMQSVVVIFDNTPPTVIVSCPIPNQYIEGAYVFKVTASDTVGLEKVTIIVFNNEFVATYSTLSGYYEYTINTVGTNDGTYLLFARAYDLSGKNTTTKEVLFNVDNNAPMLTILYPKERDYISDVYRIEANALDAFIRVVEYKIDSTQWVKMEKDIDAWYGIWDTPDFSDGSHTLTIRVMDNASHIIQQTIGVIIDNNPPICVVSAPVPNQYVEGTFTFRISAVDTVGVNYVEIKTFGSIARATFNTQTGYYEYTLDTSIWAEDAIRNVSAKAYDLSGKSKESPIVFFRVDNHAPILKINYPKNKDYVSSFVTFEVNITDAFPGPVEYNIDGSGWVPVGLPWDTTLVSDGMHDVDIRGLDLAEHSTVQSLILIVDNNAPTGIVSAPISGQTIETAFTFKVSAYDAVGIREVSVYLFDKNLTIPYNTETGYYELPMDTTIYKDGGYNITAEINDYSGKVTKTQTVLFNVDNNPPEVNWVWPISGAYISGEITLDVIVNDTFLTTVSYTVDESGWVDMEKPFNTTLVSDGEHTIT